MMDEESDIPVSPEFFTRILPTTSDLSELKVVLHVSYASARAGKAAVPLSELFRAEVVRSVAGPTSPEPGEERVRRAVDRAVASGVLLRVTAELDAGPTVYVLVSSQHNRDILERVGVNELEAWEQLGLPSGEDVRLFRPNVFALYEQHIGPLTPLIAEYLRDAERSYPRAWLEQAIQVAVRYNKRNWRYVQSVLARWAESGAPEEVV